MVSVTGSVTWISHSPSVIGMNPDPRRQMNEKHAHRNRRKGPREAVRRLAGRPRKMPLPFQGAGQGDDSPALPAGAEREPDRTETGQHEVGHPVGGESARQGALPSRIISGSKEKRFPGSNDQGQSGAELRPASRNASRTSRRGSACGPTPFVCTPDTGASRSEGRCCLRIPIGNAFRAGR